MGSVPGGAGEAAVDVCAQPTADAAIRARSVLGTDRRKGFMARLLVTSQSL
jgi:hypothetical protein